MRGLLQLLVEDEQMTITTGPSVIPTGIPMTAVGSSGTAATGWDGVFLI
jgi:hypothetical protein